MRLIKFSSSLFGGAGAGLGTGGSCCCARCRSKSFILASLAAAIAFRSSGDMYGSLSELYGCPPPEPPKA